MEHEHCHEHNHNHEITENNEKKTLAVIIITVLTMVGEIIFGLYTKSMALTADGFHMGTHALALTLTYIAYVLIRKFSGSELFPSGTEKIGTLSAYTSSLFLGITGIWIIFEATGRLFHPLDIKFDEAVIVAVTGLVVNLICIFIMENKHSRKDDKTDNDYNFKAAYYHILADALTSILAIAALVIGKYFNIIYIDAVIGILGGILILRWAFCLIKNTVVILIDMKKIIRK